MDATTFDRWTQALAGCRTRRGAMHIALISGLLAALGSPRGVEAKRKGKGKKKRKKRKKQRRKKQNCQPDCIGRDCGDDGCGGECGQCADGESCRDDGTCATGCGSCPAGETCIGNGSCASVCVYAHDCPGYSCACNRAYAAPQGYCLTLPDRCVDYPDVPVSCTSDADCLPGEGCSTYFTNCGYQSICLPVC